MTLDSKDQQYSFGGTDLLDLIGDLSIKKSLGIEDIFGFVEKAILEIAQPKYGGRLKMHSHIDRKTGKIFFMRRYKIIADEECKDVDFIGSLPILQDLPIGFSEDADRFKVDLSVESNDCNEIDETKYEAIIPLSKIHDYFDQFGEFNIVKEYLPPIQFTRKDAGLVRELVNFSLVHALRAKQYKENLSRIGTIVTGVIIKIIPNNGGICVELSGANEAFLPASGYIKGEIFKTGDRIKALLEKVVRKDSGAQLILSRSSPNLLLQLFKQEVPEIYDGIIEIKKVARDPGSRSKIAVYSSDKNIDCVGACVGIKGSRIRLISSELNGEKIDVVKYSSDLTEFVKNIFSKIEVVNVSYYEHDNKIEVIISSDDLSMAIGRRGQNVNLASSLLGCPIDILDEQGVSNKRLEQFSEGTKRLVEALDIDEVIAQLLFAEGYFSVESIAQANLSDIAVIEGFDYNVAQVIQSRAKEYARYCQIINDENFDKRLLDIKSLDENMIGVIFDKGVKSVDDLAEMDSFELEEILNTSQVSFTNSVISDIIISARKKIGMIE
ncbi:transcription termination factor NusA [Anaplasmataceae bacterium AB001_6]|nr:transcription termination factor NusA [Anaplasmataceae bacterium AB001_6]